MARIKRVAVLEGGNGGHTMSADLTLKRYEVKICEAPEFREAFRSKSLLRKGGQANER